MLPEKMSNRPSRYGMGAEIQAVSIRQISATVQIPVARSRTFIDKDHSTRFRRLPPDWFEIQRFRQLEEIGGEPSFEPHCRMGSFLPAAGHPTR